MDANHVPDARIFAPVLKFFSPREEQVPDMREVSLSQLRKWRMKKNGGEQKGPPFKEWGASYDIPKALFSPN